MKEYYEKNIESLDNKLTERNRRGRQLLTGEIIAFVAFIAWLVAFTALPWGQWALVASALSLAIYIMVRRMDEQNDRTIEALRQLKQANEHELCFLAGRYSCFADGEEYADEHHPYTFDLDIFGRDSLYQRYCRMVTDGGRDLMARMLGGDYQPLNRRLIEELAHDPDFLLRWIAVGCKEGDGSANYRHALNRPNGPKAIKTSEIRRTTQEAAELKIPSWLGSPLMLIVAWAAIIGFFGSIAAAWMGLTGWSTPAWWAVIEYFAVYAIAGSPLKNIHASMGKLVSEMSPCVALLRLVAHSTMPSLESQRKELADALPSFERLERMLRSLDSRSNLLGQFVMNVCCLSDVFLVRRFLKWQREHVQDVDRWTDVLARLDVLVTVGMMRYNEPRTTFADVTNEDAIRYETRSLYHPFLGAKAVSNDFSIADGNYYIVTGANMAGKSTFLRALGVNYILARNGMPVFAESLCVSQFALFSSMRTSDDLAHGISYFNAELLRLKQLIEYCDNSKSDFDNSKFKIQNSKLNGQSSMFKVQSSMLKVQSSMFKVQRTLIILDEILKGTNSLDKLNGSRLFLEYISQLPVSGVIATHDLELSRMADEHPETFHNYCFEIELGSRVTYSYKITPGVARNQNATFLLKEILRPNPQ